MASIDLQELADSMGSPLVIAAAPPAVPRVVAANGLAQALLRMSLDELRGKGVGEVFHTDRTGWQQAMQSPAGGTVECAVDVEPVMATRLHRSALRLRVDCRPWRKHLMLTLSTPAAAPDGAEPEDDENGRHAAEVERGVALQQVTLERLSILLVEDDTFSARVITELCGQCEYDVAHATDGHRCLDLLETSWRCETPPRRARACAIPPRNSAAQLIPLPTDRRRPPRERFNLVLVDVMMPGLNGLEVLEQIRRRYGNEIAVIMISSNDQQQMVEDCIRHGADSYLIKPLRKSDFSNIWQFVMQSSCQKLRLKHAQSQAEKRELKLQRWQQEAELKQVLAEKQHALAEAEAQSERARRERLEAAAVRQRAEQEARIDRQREQMQKQIMKLLHRQVQRYWMLAKARRAATPTATATPTTTSTTATSTTSSTSTSPTSTFSSSSPPPRCATTRSSTPPPTASSSTSRPSAR